MILDAFGVVKDDIQKCLAKVGASAAGGRLTLPPAPKMGDLSTNVAFEIASETGAKPRQIASDLAKQLTLTDSSFLASVEVAGAGYLNFRINYAQYGPFVLKQLREWEDAPPLLSSQGDLVVIEHTSVNPNKPWHIGHARNAILGDTLGRMLRTAGYRVEIQNYIDDTGVQVAETMVALSMQATNSPSGVKYDHYLGALYAEFHKALDGDANTENAKLAIEKTLHELESQVYRPIITKCLESQLETAERLGITYDLLVWESDVVHARLLEEAIEVLKQSDKVRVAAEGYQQGCLIIEMAEILGVDPNQSGEHFVDKILIRSNGLATYTAKDIALQMWKFGLLKSGLRFTPWHLPHGGTHLVSSHPEGAEVPHSSASRVINIIGSEQQYPQQVVAAALGIVGYEKQSERSVHLSYGPVVLPEGRMSGRRGIGTSADEVIEATVAEARRVIEEKHTEDLDPAHKSHIAEAVGIGAVRFAMLRHNPSSPLMFKLADIVNLTGYTALYLQYAYVRTVSILAKLTEDEVRTALNYDDHGIWDSRDENLLVFSLSRFVSEFQNAITHTNPSGICQYGYELAQIFNRFYLSMPVLSSPEPIRSRRVKLVLGAQKVLGWVLDLVGIPRLSML